MVGIKISIFSQDNVIIQVSDGSKFVVTGSTVHRKIVFLDHLIVSGVTMNIYVWSSMMNGGGYVTLLVNSSLGSEINRGSIILIYLYNVTCSATTKTKTCVYQEFNIYLLKNGRQYILL